MAAAQQGNPEKSAVELITPPAARAAERGLKFIASRQDEEGSFRSGGYSRNVAICALAGMAFMAGGSTPSRGPFGRNVNRSIDYILSNTQESGFINIPNASSHGPMYGHGFATLFLAECYGMSQRADVREKLSKAVNLIVNTQNADGGWRYQPVRRDADISVTICQVMALRRAQRGPVRAARDRRPLHRVRQAQPEPRRRVHVHDPGRPKRVSPLGRRRGGPVQRRHLRGAGDRTSGLEYLLGFVPKASDVNRESHYFYGHYYAVQAMWHAGGEYWTKWYPAIRDALVARQADDGSWSDSICTEYGTAMACIILQMPNNYLPIFQR